MKFKTKAFKKIAHKIRKYAPEIMTAVGAVSVTTGAVLACKQTLKLDSVVRESETNLRYVEDAHNDQAISDKEYKKEVTKEKLNLVKNIGELYAIPAGLGVIGLGLMIGSTAVARKRYTNLAGAYVTLETAYKTYRQRVIDKYGLEEDTNFVTGKRKGTIETVDENGKKKKEEVEFLDNKDFGSPYCFIFDETTAPRTYVKPDWDKGISPAFALESNINFLRSNEKYINDILVANASTGDVAGVFENEILHKLGMKKVDMGQDVGITYKEGDMMTDINGDLIRKQFTLGLQVLKDPNTFDNIILLNMNLEGNIRDRLFENEED